MMTIKEFASLCGCNAQTLRYYDKIDLLKPVKVDQWSGYRYYDKNQAIDFVKIKNLQAADFRIDEIKVLITLSDSKVYDAFDQKIAEQAHKLEQIRKIQQSYLTEKNNMEKIVKSSSDFLFHAISNYELLREFGMSPEDGAAVVGRLKEFYEQQTRQYLSESPDVQLILNGSIIRGTEQIVETFETLKDKGYDDTVLLTNPNAPDAPDVLTLDNSDTVWECHGWSFVYEFLNQIPPLESDCEYCFHFQLTEEKYTEGLEFPMFMIAAILPQLDSESVRVGCSINRSEDGKNHFHLQKK